MPLYGFKDKQVRDRLRDMSLERMSRSDLELRLGDPSVKDASARGFVVILDYPAPACYLDDEVTDEWVLGISEGVVFQRERTDSDTGISQFVENNVGSSHLVPMRDSDNACLRKRVYNYLQEIAPSCVPLEAMQDVYGDLYISSIPSGLAPSPEETTTTPVPCSGFCKWYWNATTYSWTLDSDRCNTTTTSTTTTTTTPNPSTTTTAAPATTTTLDPCTCTTTTPNPEDTTLPDCECLYPTHCGNTHGECYYSQCGRNEVSVLVPCTSTTTTTCDCNTTTTSEVCNGSCSWAYFPTGWELVDSSCPDSCPCREPTALPAYCSNETTYCLSPGYEPCSGNCMFIWYEASQTWYPLWVGCTAATDPCVCTPPSQPGNDCGTVIVPCGTPASSGNTGACAHCYQNSTTTTTPDLTDCAGDCKWTWSPGTSAWVAGLNTCSGGCTCLPPAIDGQLACQVEWTNCFTVLTTTTTTTSTTTTSTTTTTTTTSTTTTTPAPGACGDDCTLQCIGGILYDVSTIPFGPCNPASGCVCTNGGVGIPGSLCFDEGASWSGLCQTTTTAAP